jgi:threonine dehydrogenase-like Zn-dependent dehydrogenase
LQTAQAAVLTAFNRPLERREFPLPNPGEGEVLVQITAAGVCGSDAHMWRGRDPRTPLPIILGHEGVGKVAAVGGERRTIFGEPVRPGDEILWHRGVSCGDCYYCTVVKEPSLCPARLVYGINRDCAAPPHLRGCYATHILLDRNTALFPLPPGLDPAVMVSVTCSGSTMAHAFDLAPPVTGDTVLVQGPGPLGLYAVAFARARGAGRIIVIGGTPSRLELCREFGAAEVLNRNELSGEERFRRVMELTGGRGVDLAVETVGLPEALAEGIPMVRPGGTYLSTGFGEPGGELQLDCFGHLVRRNLRLQGVWVSDARHTYMAYKLVLRQPELFAAMVTHRFPLAEATAALEAMEQKEAVKAVIEMGGE